MGSVFGKESVKEPPHEVLLRRSGRTPYEMRRYCVRYAAWTPYEGGDNSSPFRSLARYIGVFGTPENEGKEAIAMTAPVVMEKGEPESIAMTAPVVMEGEGSQKRMMFMLPAEYDSMDKIPKPTNPKVHIAEVPSEVGVVHRYNGSMEAGRNRDQARALADQLIEDGVPDVTEEYVLENFQFWGYNPPFTLPYFRRNEVWLKLDGDQVTYLQEKFPSGGLVGGSRGGGSALGAVGIAGLVVGVAAIGLVMRRKGSSSPSYSPLR